MILYSKKTKLLHLDISKLYCMRRLAILFLCFMCALHSSAEESPKLKRAENLYAHFAYKEAIVLYEELFAQQIDVQKVSERLANSYRLINDTKNTELWYEKYIAYGKYTASDVFYYSLALRSNGKTKQADEWMLLFKKLSANDSRALAFDYKETILKEIHAKKANFAIKNLGFNTEGIEFSPAFLNDKQLAFVASDPNQLVIKREFSWNQTPFLDVYLVDKLNDTTFGIPYSIPGKVNSKFHDGPATFTKAGDLVYFTRNNYLKNKKLSSDGVLKLKLFTAQKNAKGKWKNINEVDLGTKEYSVGHPSLSEDGTKIVFTSDMPGSIGGTDIWMITKSGNAWSKPINLGPQVNTEGNEMFPYIAYNGDLFFASNGHLGLGGLDLFYAPLKNNEYRNVVNMGAGLNSSHDDFGLIVTPDFKQGYFTSNREGGKGDDDIYAVRFLKPIQIKLLQVTIEDRLSHMPLIGANVSFKINENKLQYLTDSLGKIELIINPLDEVLVDVSRENYTPISQLNLTNDSTYQTIQQTIELISNQQLVYQSKVIDHYTQAPISDVKVSVKSKKYFNQLLTDANGDLFLDLTSFKKGDKIQLDIRLEKEGYLGKEILITKVIDAPGLLPLLSEKTISMYKLEVGLEIGKAIKINPIYFDYGKDAIRPDAATELDKIVKILKRHPEIVIELGSHTDCRSSIRFNNDLSDRRAKSSVKYLVEHGIAEDRLYGKGYGESRLVNKCECEDQKAVECSEEQHQQNRRTEFVIKKIRL
jgi:outer membrane protein OmpA-like peptidoglycan-associated protein